MEWTTAGVLPVSTINNDECYLLAQDAYTGKWSDFGGVKEGDEESRSVTAARETSVKSRGILGSIDEIRAYAIETITYGPSVTFICQWPLLEAPSLPSQFERAERTHPRHHETKCLSWVKTQDVYEAVAKAAYANPTRVNVNGKWLHERLVGTIRKTYAYSCYLREHSQLRPTHISEMRAREVTVGLREDNVKSGICPLVVLTDDQDNPSSVFAVLHEGNKPEELEIENRSYLNPSYVPGIFERIWLATRALFRFSGPAPSADERQVIWQALQHQSLWARLKRDMLNWRCQRGGVSKVDIERLQRPVTIY